MMYLSDNTQADVIESFDTTSRYLEGLLNIENPFFFFFEGLASQIYPNKDNSMDTEEILF